MSEMTLPAKRPRYHGWFPRHREVYKTFIETKVAKAKSAVQAREQYEKGAKSTGPSGWFNFGLLWRENGRVKYAEHKEPVARFAAAIVGDNYMRKQFEFIFLQANPNPKWVDPDYAVTNFETLLYLLDDIVEEPPAYYKARREDGTILGESIGLPMLLVFDLLSNTCAAYDLFRYDPFNAALRDLLNSWGTFLKSPASNTTLTTGPEGWFGPEAMTQFEPNLRPLSFEDTYICPDPKAENKGFQSWDDFFIRKFQPTARPVVAPDNHNYIHNACESTTLRIAHNVKLHDTFWLKEQNYSLYDMLGGSEEDARPFIGGTVYQAYLSPTDYHRWHSPVNGTVIKTVVLPGVYYAALPDDGAPAGDLDLEEGNPIGVQVRCQPWLTVAATRALVFIQSDNPDIGLMCFIAVGMAEVSTCEVTVQVDQGVAFGDELGMFHFGGSSHVLVFGPQVKIAFEDFEGRPIEVDYHYRINTVIAKITQG